MTQAFTKVEDIGFLALLEQLREYRGTPSEAFPPSLDITSRQTVFTTGRGHGATSITHGLVWFQDGVHFDLATHPLPYLGRKILTSAVTDALALNATPDHIRVSLAIPNLLSVEMIHEVMRGLDSACKQSGISIVGLECNPCHQHFGIALSLFSLVTDDQAPILPSGAKTGESLCVTGDLGAAFAGLRVLLREKNAWQRSIGGPADSGSESGQAGDGQSEDSARAFKGVAVGQMPGAHFQPDLEGFERVVERQLAPQPRTDFIQAIATSGLRPTAIVPLRLGLYNDIHQLMAASRCGAEIFVSALPIDVQTRAVADEMMEEVDRYALAGGEDFEFLFTLPADQVDRFQDAFKDFTVIGHVLAGEKGLVIHTPEEE